MSDFKIVSIDEKSTYFDIDISFEKTDSFAQKILLLLNTWKNEFAYDTQKGIDYQAVLRDDFNYKNLEAFFLFSLKNQIDDFNTFEDFTIEYHRDTESVDISFLAYAKNGESAKVDNFTI